MPKYPQQIASDQKGSALLIIIIVVLALTAIGITALRTSTLDSESATNFKFKKLVTYATDGATQMAAELLEQNIEEGGFNGPTPIDREQVKVNVGNFYLNEENADCNLNNPSASNYDIKAPKLGMGSVYIRVYGNTQLSTGNALQIAAGDKGRGKGLAGGGAWITYDIRGLGQGSNRSSASVLLRWVHPI